MAAKVKTFSEVVERWPTRQDLASDCKVELEAVRKWQERGRIPAYAWRRLLRAADKRSINVSVDDLLRLAEAG